MVIGEGEVKGFQVNVDVITFRLLSRLSLAIFKQDNNSLLFSILSRANLLIMSPHTKQDQGQLEIYKRYKRTPKGLVCYEVSPSTLNRR